MICIMIMLMCVKVAAALMMTTNAALLLNHQIQAFHNLGYHDQKVLSSGLSRKLMLKNMGEGYEDQELQMFYNDKKKAYLDVDDHEIWKKGGEEVMVNEAPRSDPTEFSTMDYSHVRRRRPIHNNNFSPKGTNLP